MLFLSLCLYAIAQKIEDDAFICSQCIFPHTMHSPRSVQSFQIRGKDGQIQTGPVTDLNRLVDFLREHGLSEIAKVSFYIIDERDPDEFCNVILRNRGDRLVPEFCETNQEGDWDLVLGALDFGNLDEMFVRHIEHMGIRN